MQPLRLRLPAGHVTVELSARPEILPEIPPAGAAPALSLELCGGGRWPRLRPMLRRLSASEAGVAPARWDFAADDLRRGTRSIEFDVPAAPPDQAEGTGEIDLRITNHRPADLALARLSIRHVRRSRQKDLIIIGNCHATMVYHGFLQIPALQRHFRCRFYDVNLSEQLSDEPRRAVESGDMLLVQDISNWTDCVLRQSVPERARIVMFPCIRFASLWPFDGCNGPTDQLALAQEAPNMAFPYLDGLLARLRAEIPDRERRFEAYRSLDVGGIVDYARVHQFESRRLLALDRKYDCEIGRFTLDRFQSEQVFYTTNHPNGRIFELLMGNIVRSLEIAAEVPHIEPLDQMRTQQVPVHPKVAEALGVRWATPARRYLFRQQELTWEEYVRRYIEHYG